MAACARLLLWGTVEAAARALLQARHTSAASLRQGEHDLRSGCINTETRSKEFMG